MRRVVTSWILAAVCVSSAWAVEPANRKSNPQVKAVLEYFYSLSGKTDNRIVSGQFTDFGNGSNLKIMDMLGLDAYTDFLDPEHIQGYDEIVALSKPFGFSEYGPHGSSNPPGDYDYRRFIEGVKKHFPKTCYFMCWNAKWSLATNQNVREMLSDPAVANRDELPKELFSNGQGVVASVLDAAVSAALAAGDRHLRDDQGRPADIHDLSLGRRRRPAGHVGRFAWNVVKSRVGEPNEVNGGWGLLLVPDPVAERSMAD